MKDLQKIIYHMRQIDALSQQCKILMFGMFFTMQSNTQIQIHEPNGYEILCEIAETMKKSMTVTESNSHYTYTVNIDGLEVMTSVQREITMYEELQKLRHENQKLKEELRFASQVSR